MPQKKNLRNEANNRRKNQLRDVLSDGPEDSSEGADYTSMLADFPSDVTLEKEPTAEVSIDIYKVRSAPAEWNFYSPLPDDKMLELIESITAINLQNRVIVWEDKSRDSYLMLSGHNRLDAFKKIYESTNDEKYRTIPAKVYRHDELDEAEAKEIIIDTNFVQRSLKPIERAQSIMAKIEIVNKRRELDENIKGRTRDIIADRYDLKGRMVDNYKKLIGLIDPFKELVNTNVITINSGVAIAGLSQEDQAWLFEEYGKELENSVLTKIKKNMSRDDIVTLFEDKGVGPTHQKLKVKIPYGYDKEFTEYVMAWRDKKNFSTKDVRIIN